MRWWDEQVVPRVTDLSLGLGEVHKLRSRVCAGLVGDVVEIGFGSGLNVGHYPAAVRSVSAVEPSDVAWKIARRRLSQTPAQVTRAGLDGERLDLPSSSFDSALSTFTMCTIPDLAAALSELVRVLRPGGLFQFVEHGRAADPAVLGRQQRWEPLQKRLAGGCHLTRPIDACIGASGLQLVEIDTFYGPGPKPLASLYLGCARKPA